MNVQLELWHLITLLIGFFGFTAGFGKVLLDQVEKRLNERHATLGAALEQHLSQEKEFVGQLKKLEHDFLGLRAELPVQYVRREDYIRGQSVIEAKLDALYNKLEVVQLRGQRND